MNAMRFLLRQVLTLLLALPICVSAQGLSSDFDQDGKSDFATVSIQSNGDLKWTSVNPLSGITSLQGILGTSGQQIILANWMQVKHPMIGVVSSNSNSKLVWQIADNNGKSTQRVFGDAASLAVSGGDFDGNGVADAATARLIAGKVNWKISLNPFSLPEDAQLLKTGDLGSDLSTAFFAAPRAGRDWIANIFRLENGKSVLKFKDIESEKVLQSASFAVIAGRPFPVQQANGADIIGFSAVRGSSTLLEFRSIKGRLLLRTLVPSLGDVVVGDFTKEAGEEVAIKSSSSKNYFVLNIITKKITQISGETGIAVDAININQVDAPQPISKPTTPISGKVTCSTIVDIESASNILFKNENVHGGRGRTWLDQDRQEAGVRRLSVAGLNGKVFSCFGLYRCDSPYGCRYYQAMCGDTLDNAAFLAAAIKNSEGQPYAVATSGNGKCYKFRADVSRYGSVRK